MLEVIEAVGRAVGRATPYAVGARRVGDPACLVANPARAGCRLGWRPRFLDLDETVATAVAWRRKPAFGDHLLSGERQVA